MVIGIRLLGMANVVHSCNSLDINFVSQETANVMTVSQAFSLVNSVQLSRLDADKFIISCLFTFLEAILDARDC